MIEKVNKSMENLIDSLLDYSVGVKASNDDLGVKEYLTIISDITQNMKRLFDMGISIGNVMPENNKEDEMSENNEKISSN